MYWCIIYHCCSLVYRICNIVIVVVILAAVIVRMMSNTLYYYLNENPCYNGDRNDLIHSGNDKNVIINIIVIINSTIINIVLLLLLWLLR